MWERIKRLWQKPEQPSSLLFQTIEEQETQVEYLWQELQSQRFDGLEQRVRPLMQSSFPVIVEKATRILALAHFHQQHYAQAWPLFEQLAQKSGSVNDWFNVVSSATLAGELDKGAAAFDEAVQSHEAMPGQQPSVSTMRYFYACALRDMKEYARAFEHMEILRGEYEKHPITSNGQLQAHGLPPLDHLLDLMVEVLLHSGDIPEAVQWLQDFGRKLDGPGQTQTNQAADRLQQLSH